MLKKSKVLFKGKGSGLIIYLDENSSYEDIKAELIEKVNRSKSFFKGANEDIVFEGKKLTSLQENEIVDIIINNAGLEVGFINAEPDVISRKTSIKHEQDMAPIKNIYDEESVLPNIMPFNMLTEKDEKVFIYHGFVRSGKLVEANQNIIIIGGVNPGGEVFAGKNIVVFGPLKGRAIAGKNGGQDCFIAAILMEPELLGINTYVTRFPAEKKFKLSKTPSIARLDLGKIVITPIGNLGITK